MVEFRLSMMRHCVLCATIAMCFSTRVGDTVSYSRHAFYDTVSYQVRHRMHSLCRGRSVNHIITTAALYLCHIANRSPSLCRGRITACSPLPMTHDTEQTSSLCTRFRRFYSSTLEDYFTIQFVYSRSQQQVCFERVMLTGTWGR
jgi:hypothetical protein